MRLRGGGYALAAVLLFSVLVIRGGGEVLKPSHAPTYTRKVLLSITSGDLHASSISPTPWSLGLATAPPALSPTHPSKQQNQYAPSPTTILEGQNASPSYKIAPSVRTGNEVPNPPFHKQVPTASPSLPVQPPASVPTISVSTPAAAPFLPQIPWSSSPSMFQPPTPPSIGGQSAPPVSPQPASVHSPPPSLTPTDWNIQVASPPYESSSQRKSPSKAIPPTSVTPSRQDKDGISVVAPPNKLSHNSSPPKAISQPIDRNKDNIAAAPPRIQPAIAAAPPPQRGKSLHSNVSAVSPSSITSPAVHGPRYGLPVAAPPEESSNPSSPANYSHFGGSSVSPPPNTPAARQGKTYGIPVAAPPKHLPPLSYPHMKRPAVPPASKISPPVLTPPKRTSRSSLPVNNSRVERTATSPATKVPPIHHGKAHGVLAAAPPRRVYHHSMHHRSLPVNNAHAQGPSVSPSSKAPNVHRRRHGIPVAAPPKERPGHSPTANKTRHKGSFPVISPAPHKADNASTTIHAPSSLPHRLAPAPAPAPVGSLPSSKRKGSPAYAPHRSHHLPSYSPAPMRAPVISRKHRPKHAPPPFAEEPVLPPAHPPDSPAFMKPKAPAPEPVQSLPPPPPNLYCMSLSCQDPYTNSPPGATCLCVLPIKVQLRLGIALYTFFTLVSELAQEIASGVLMKQSQVRVMGANAATEDPEKTVVLIDLVPLGENFDNTTALLVYERFWHKQVFINPTIFGNYDVLYVIYQGLPPSPPTASANMNNGLSNVNDPRLRPIAVDVGNQNEKKNRGIVAIIVISSVFAFVLCAGAALVIYFKLRNRNCLTEASVTPTKAAGAGSVVVGSRLGSRHISASPSFSSSVVAYKGSAKTFSLFEIERATHRFDESRIIGEGGFGRVYEGILEDGQRVAVKVLKRDDQQGGREFLAEVEMLSRLHHRNLVKLIGICTEEQIRCLVYELVPNGSVESHLHGSDKETAPLDWDVRLKIALGAARALAYLHEDSSPRVIHRDFKSSNILLEHDFTPKVSDFGLARTALGEGNEHISTRVMGTFGYVAPEYAMTGHLLVKSDVYSYGVVLLELLTGRKPVDMLRPPGQENLVAWARPLLTSRDGLEMIIDPSLGSSILFDSLAKVAAIASMCVQPEVDQRPFMGDVVQALKLVCNEGSEFNGSASCSQEDLNIQDAEIRSNASLDMEVDQELSASELFTASAHYAMDASGSFRRYSSSGPLRVSRTGQDRGRGLSTGSSSEHGGVKRFRIGPE